MSEIVVITGASRGIGHARAFAERNAPARCLAHPCIFGLQNPDLPASHDRFGNRFEPPTQFAATPGIREHQAQSHSPELWMATRRRIPEAVATVEARLATAARAGS